MAFPVRHFVERKAQPAFVAFDSLQVLLETGRYQPKNY